MVVSTAMGNTGDHVILSGMLKERLGMEIRVVPFNGSGEEMASVLGGHSDMMWGNPTEIMAQFQTGAMRPVAVTTAKRLLSLPDVPTLRELGHDIELIQMRALVMPKDVPQEAVKYWVDVLRKVSESDEWRTGYIAKYLVEPMFMHGDELQKRVDNTSQMYEERLKKIGAIK
jgi:putative tricarboxylic transport membrane protein